MNRVIVLQLNPQLIVDGMDACCDFLIRSPLIQCPL